MTWALLPLKDLVQAKSRLSGVLAPFERRALAQAMVEDVIAVLSSVLGTRSGLDGVLLVSDDPAAELLARHYGIDLVEERHLGCQGLNDAIDSATGFLRARGVQDIMVLHSDLPLLTAEDLRSALALYAEPDTDVLIAPDRAGTGTNLMIFPVARAPSFQYGEGSCQAHSASAEALGLSVVLLQRRGLQCDVDNPADVIEAWRALRDDPEASHSSRVLCHGEVVRRLALMARDGLGSANEGSQNDAV